MLDARYYDGKSARQYAVQLRLQAGVVHVGGQGIEREELLADTVISERYAGMPRKLSFRDGAYCEIDESPELAAMLEQAGVRVRWVESLQASWSVALISVVLICTLTAAAYVWGVPAAADMAARSMPVSVSRMLSQQTVKTLDRLWLEPSGLSQKRQDALSSAFQKLQPANAEPQTRLEFRASPEIGANAFALPDGTVVLLDELVALADDDAQILGVLGHELGHVQHRHGLRMLVQGSLVGAFSVWWFGDASALLAAVPAALAQAHYSREFETEADDYGVQLLRANGISPVKLAEMLEKLMHAHDAKRPQTPASEDSAEWTGYLESHPAPAERIRRLREAATE